VACNINSHGRSIELAEYFSILGIIFIFSVDKRIYMRKGDVAISYMVAIFLAVIAMAAIIYLLSYYLNQSSIDCDKCGADLAAWCAQCYGIYGAGDWGGGNAMSNDLKECATKCSLPTSSGCDNTAKYFCKPYLPF
jgi:hypothetical protein